MKAPCLPGKTMNLMAAQKPIIALVPEDCETARVINEADCGRVVNPGDGQKLHDTILDFIHNPDMMKKMGTNGRTFLIKNMTLENSVKNYEEIFRKLHK
jgi:colanic acid biosynthesis glycosyl transferase WcaI